MNHSKCGKSLVCDLPLKQIFDSTGILPFWIFLFIVFTSYLFKSCFTQKKEIIDVLENNTFSARYDNLIPGSQKVQLSFFSERKCRIEGFIEIIAIKNNEKIFHFDSEFIFNSSKQVLFQDSEINYNEINASFSVVESSCPSVEIVWESIDPVFNFYNSVIRIGLSVFAVPLAFSYFEKLKEISLSKEQHLTGLLVIISIFLFSPMFITIVSYPIPRSEQFLMISRDIFLSYFMFYVFNLMNYLLKSKIVFIYSFIFSLISCCLFINQDLNIKIIGIREVLPVNTNFDFDYTQVHKLIFSLFFVNYLILLCASYFNRNSRFLYYSITTFVTLVIFQLHFYVKIPFSSIDKIIDLALFVMYEYGHLFIEEVFD